MIAKVYSFHRSGTYWLCSLLKSRFYMDTPTTGPLPKYLDCVTGGEILRKPGRYMPTKAMPFEGWGSERGRTCQWKGLLGGHPCLPRPRIFTTGNKPIYIIRSGKDVMVSLWRLRNCVRSDTVSFLDWFNKFYPGRNKTYVFPTGAPIAGLWHWATQMWLKCDKKLFIVRYEDLLEDKESVLDKIAAYLDLPKGDAQQVENRLVGIAPNKGRRIGSWTEHFDMVAVRRWQECGDIARQLVRTGGMVWPK